MSSRVESGWCGLVFLACALGLAAPSGAQAYTLRYTRAGQPVRWVGASVPMRVDAALVSDRDESMNAAGLAFATWGGLRGVPALEFAGETRGTPGYTLRGDNENGVYRVATLPISGVALAVTVSTYREDDGTLLDADVLVAGSRELGLLDDLPRGGDRHRYDLASLLAHESGHVLGLGESAEDDSATMWPRLRRGDTDPRTIEADDEAALRDLYANAGLLTRASCGVEGPAGHGRSGAGALSVLAVVALALALRRSERRRLLAGVASIALMSALSASQPVARADDGRDGRARIVDVRWEHGMLVTELEIITPSGCERLVVPGGVRDGIVQQIGEALPPIDGAEVRLGAVGADGLRDRLTVDDEMGRRIVRTTKGRPPASAR